MKRKELTKTFMLISYGTTPSGLHGFIKYQRCERWCALNRKIKRPGANPELERGAIDFVVKFTLI